MLFSALNVGPSLLADIVLLPALLSSARFVTLWDVLAVRLGRAPQESIPLLRGLRAGEARIAVLLGDLRSVAAGERIMTRGEAGNEMLVLIRGRAQVFGASNGRRVALGSIGRGDVIGEMGFVRHRPRTADIEAVELISPRELRIRQDAPGRSLLGRLHGLTVPGHRVPAKGV